jgi:hypothetical protein
MSFNVLDAQNGERERCCTVRMDSVFAQSTSLHSVAVSMQLVVQ